MLTRNSVRATDINDCNQVMYQKKNPNLNPKMGNITSKALSRFKRNLRKKVLLTPNSDDDSEYSFMSEGARERLRVKRSKKRQSMNVIDGIDDDQQDYEQQLEFER